MLNQVINKIQLLPLVEPSNLLPRINVKLANDWDKEHGVRKKLIVNHEYRFLYCPIHKNASSSIIKAILTISKSNKKEKLLNSSRNTIRTYIDLNHSLANYTYAQALQIINSDYFKFVIVRNPWARLVSTYLNLFVRLFEKKQITQLAKDSAKYIYGEDDFEKYEDSIKFEQFVQYVCNTDDKIIDPHCKSQYFFLGGLKYDFIGRMENLSHDLEYIKNRLNLSLELPKVNKTDYSTPSDIINNYPTLSASDLRSLKTGFPSYQNFYTPELIDLVAERYAKDIEMFGYEFV
ncbi:MAG: sulfotransferase family protein [Cyanobacteria bacterium P01_D01_bin.50]